MDRSNGSTRPVAPELLRVMQYDLTIHNTGSSVKSMNEIVSDQDELPPNNDDGMTIENESRTKMIFGKTSACTKDWVAWNSSTFSSSKPGIDNELYFPTLFAYGRGGLSEKRIVKLSLQSFVQRCMRVKVRNGIGFQLHTGFCSTSFDDVATHKAFQGQYRTMRVNASAIRAGKFTKSDLSICREYSVRAEHNTRMGLRVSIYNSITLWYEIVI